MKIVNKFEVVQPQAFLVILSADVTCVSDVALKVRRESIEHFLDANEFSFKKVEDVFTHANGVKVTEQSYAVGCDTPEAVFELAKQAHYYDQECMLVVNESADAYLTYPLKGCHGVTSVYIGVFTKVSESEIHNYENYTKVSKGGFETFYTVIKSESSTKDK